MKAEHVVMTELPRHQVRNRENDHRSDNVETVEYSQAHHQVVKIFLVKILNKVLKKIRLGSDTN